MITRGVDLAAVERDDQLLDMIGAIDYQPDETDARVTTVLAGWRREVLHDADRILVDVDTAQAVIAAATPAPDACWSARCWVRLALTVVLIAALLIILAGCGASEPVIVIPAGPTATVTAPVPPPVASVTETIPRYDERAFGGSRWAPSTDQAYGPKCTTRGIVLAKHAAQLGPPVDTDADGCKDDGRFTDLYTGRSVDPVADDEEVDHVFAQADAWRNGAWRWNREQLWAFRNDQTNLRATFGHVNAAKSDLGPDEWRPEAESGWCGYAQVYQHTAHTYDLFISPARQAALADMLATCDARP